MQLQQITHALAWGQVTHFPPQCLHRGSLLHQENNSARPQVGPDAQSLVSLNPPQVEEIKHDIATAEGKLEKLRAMGGAQLEQAQAAVEEEVQAQQAEVEQQVTAFTVRHVIPVVGSDEGPQHVRGA